MWSRKITMKRLKKTKLKLKNNQKSFLIWTVGFALVGSFFVFRSFAATGACSTSGVIGTSSHTISVPESSQYKIWVRMQVPDTANTNNVNGVKFELNSNQCFVVTTTNSNAVNQWQWINSSASAVSTPNVTSQLTSGNQTVKILGLKAGVKVDKVILLKQDNTCVPSNNFSNGSPGENCTTPAPTVNLSVSPNTLTGSGSSTINWSSTNATACTAGGGWSGAKNTGGSQSTGTINSTATYTLTCTGVGGSANASTTVTVNPFPTPTLSLNANPTTINAGSSSVLTWTTTNATACTAGNGWSGSKAATGGSQSTGNLTSTTTYTLVCSGPGGTTPTRSVTVTTTTPPSTDTTKPTIVTTIPGVTIPAGNEPQVRVNTVKTISWQPFAADASGISSLVVTVNGQPAALVNGEVKVAVNSNGYTPNGNYELRAVARDNNGNETVSTVTIKLRHPDINRNGRVDVFDLNSVLNNWNSSSPGHDLNDSGRVDIFDLNYVLNRWGNTN